MAEHVDRMRLQTDLRYRFDYIAKFLNFTNNDILVLNSLASSLLLHIPSIVETMKKKMQFFNIQQQLSNEDYEHFIVFLDVYLKRILSQSDWNDTFLQYLSEFGECSIHGNHLPFLRMNYTRINMLLGYLEYLMISTISTSEHVEISMKYSAIKAMNKFFWIQNNFIAMHHEKSLKTEHD